MTKLTRRETLKERVRCPSCGKLLTRRALEDTHRRNLACARVVSDRHGLILADDQEVDFQVLYADAPEPTRRVWTICSLLRDSKVKIPKGIYAGDLDIYPKEMWDLVGACLGRSATISYADDRTNILRIVNRVWCDRATRVAMRLGMDPAVVVRDLSKRLRIRWVGLAHPDL